MSDLEYDLRMAQRLATTIDTTVYQVSAGVIMATAATLYKITDENGLEGTEIIYFVVRSGNPCKVIVKTESPAVAHRAFADEIDRADKEQAERVMWRR
jgi:hypothetical protein